MYRATPRRRAALATRLYTATARSYLPPTIMFDYDAYRRAAEPDDATCHGRQHVTLSGDSAMREPEMFSASDDAN